MRIPLMMMLMPLDISPLLSRFTATPIIFAASFDCRHSPRRLR